MWGHLVAILGLALLCALWVLFQRWVGRVDPDGRNQEIGCSGCAGVCEDDTGNNCSDAAADCAVISVNHAMGMNPRAK
jgi:hypothetical protein